MLLLSMISLIVSQCKKYLRQKFFILISLIFPLISLAILGLLFSPKSPKDLPICIVDYDKSQLSRKITRNIDATKTIKVISASSKIKAQENMLRGKAYGLLVIDKDYEKNVLRGTPRPLLLSLNSQMLMPASLIFKAAFEAVGNLSVQMRTKQLAQKKISLKQGFIFINSHVLFNPMLNYANFLLPSILFAVLHILLLSAASGAIASDYKSGDLYTKKTPIKSLLAKSIINIGIFSVWGMIYYVFSTQGVNNFWLVGVAIVLFMSAYWFLGLALVLFFRSVRMGTSSIAFIATPAFAFSGITFPVYAMPLVARIWGEALPLTHFLRILVDQTTRQALPSYSFGSLMILLGFFALFFALFLGLIKYRITYVKPYIR